MAPGFAFASVTQSVSVLYLESVAAMNRNGELATWITGVRSLTGSMVPVRCTAGAITMLSTWPITMS